MSTLEHRHWLAGGASVPKVRKCLEFIQNADQIILNGDTLDYLSHGAMELMQREIWDRYPGIIATVGGYKFARRMQGTVPETLSREDRVRMVELLGKHDIYCFSKLYVSPFEHSATGEEFEAWWSADPNSHTGKPAKDSFTSDLDLIILQLGDNVSSQKLANFLSCTPKGSRRSVPRQGFCGYTAGSTAP